MLTFVTSITSLLLLLLTVLQAIYVFRYQKILETGSSGESHRNGIAKSVDEEPSSVPFNESAAILLCLRGVDPTMSECLAGIVGQDYQNYQVHIVFDHADDPAVEYVRDFFDDQPNQPVLHFSSSHPKTCSLKCSNLIAAINGLPESVKLIALIDADTVADENWLIDLLAPFADPTVGATTGNRWFTPPESSIGTVFRKVWNAAAVPQVTLYNIGWGGSLAFRREVLHDAGFLGAWKNAFCEDTMVAETLQPLGLSLKRVPSLIMENTESTTLADAFRWIVRQTLTVRLHHRMWPLVMAHGVLTAIACYVTPVLICIAVIVGEYSNAWTLVRFFVLYQLFNIGLLMVIDHGNRKILSKRASGRPSEQDASTLGTTIVATVLNQYLFPLAVYETWKLRSVDWRGITYGIDRSNRIEMEAYVPYREVCATRAASEMESKAESIH